VGELVPMIGYVRVSWGREAMISPEIQETTITRWTALNGRRIVYWVRDLDDTGRNFKRRVTQAIAGISNGDAAEIGVYRYDRWGRTAVGSLANVHRVEQAGGGVISVTEPFDVETAIGRYGRTNAFAVAELQSDQIGEAWKAVHSQRTSGRKLPAAGTPRFGYQRLGRIPDPDRKHTYRRDPDDPAGERYEPDPVTGPVLASLYERYVAGEGPRALARWLNTEGHLTMRGARWAHTSVAQVLASGFGAGLLRVHDRACKCGRTVNQCRSVLYLPGAHEPVIGPELWAAFRARWAERASTPPRSRDPVYPLSGVLVCGGCRHNLTVVHNYAVTGWGYRCPRRGEHGDCPTGAFVRSHTAEETVLEWLSHLAADIEAQAATVAARSRVAKRTHTQAGRLRAQETKLVNRIATLLARQADDTSTPREAYEKARADAVAELGEVRAQLAAVTTAEATNTGEYLPVAVGLVEEWHTFPAGVRRTMLKTLIREVVVHKTGFRQPPRIEIVPVWAVTEP